MTSDNQHQSGPGRDDHDPDPQGGGEDESSSSQDGHDGHLHDDQKPLNPAPASSDADDVSQDDPQKTEKLAKSGRDIDPDGGSD